MATTKFPNPDILNLVKTTSEADFIRGSIGDLTETEAIAKYRLYKGLTNSSGSPTSLFGGGSGSGIDSFTDKIVAMTGPVGRVFSTMSDIVKGVANVGEKIYQSQMGVKDDNSGTQAIFEALKSGGLNIPRLLISSGEEVLKQFEQQSILLSEIGMKTGLVGQLGDALRDDMIEASIEGARYGASLKEIGQFYVGLVESSGKFSLINQDTYDTAIPLSRALNVNLEELSRTLFDYEKVGVGLSKSIENLEGATVRSLSLGLSAKKVTETMKNDIGKLNEYGFKDGVRGLERMSQKALEFRMSMDGAFKIAEKVFEPEGALNLAANLQVLGGAFGAFNDPIKLMYMATNDVEGLQDALIDAAGSLASYNTEQGRFEITGVNLRRAKAMASELGVEYKELANGAIAAAERTSASAALMSSGLVMKDEDREFLTNISRMDGGEMKITVPKSLVDELGGRSEILLRNISEQEKSVLLANSEAFKQMDTKEIAMNQLTQTQQMSRGIDVIASYAKVRAAAFLETNTKKYAGGMFDELQKNIDSFSTEIGRENKKTQTSTNQPVYRVFPEPSVSSSVVNAANVNIQGTRNNATTSTPSPLPQVYQITHTIQSNGLGDAIAREMSKNPYQVNAMMEKLFPAAKSFTES
jgi:hypothetical protein